MDIFKYINSKDIRDHLKQIGYTFSSLEAAWLIWQCRDLTIKEKHRAWDELIDTMPDCEIPERLNTCAQKSLHGFLRRYMEIEDRLIRSFYDEKIPLSATVDTQCVYRFELKYDTSYEPYLGIYTVFDALLNAMKQEYDDARCFRCTK